LWQVSAGQALPLLMLTGSISAETALRIGAVQQICDEFDTPLAPPHGAMLLLMRSLLANGVWQVGESRLCPLGAGIR
jgi:enoyl-CoA hydratase/carnithine racemase